MSQKDMLQISYFNHQMMESQQEVLTPGEKGSQDTGESIHYPTYRRTAEPDRAYPDSSRLTRSKPTNLLNFFTPFRHQKIIYQELQFFTIPGTFQE
ncbi:hypothetical protein O181_028405 [Austropuccinia psidii MF-1]|uniref:Uncharacterized protein n=1 Tax=Austropuccinia psidii MF-1 TaxID=1389203 RepID=A0A9Q3CT91_9BASI|nr:hypothetical protein [Austropuccinia psidii MF-1]